MRQKEFIIQFEEGLHARPASELTRLCHNYQADIRILKDAMRVDPKSILGILTLGVSRGDSIVVETEGTDEDDAIIALEEFFKQSN
jgi:phosphocarrier protein